MSQFTDDISLAAVLVACSGNKDREAISARLLSYANHELIMSKLHQHVSRLQRVIAVAAPSAEHIASKLNAIRKILDR